ncbi:MAG: SUMF1/EgtB/PvdO family nonheme iron enzyme [Candidatus Cloacimonas sp.]|jgi:formylglycine-generating enzyme required for sulfatase activity/predicted nucleic acid-binding Zn ribbon protein|nr:SUMF1/EgtB/PvdO family nonheme iron enzyme [Candidatus Cloacimonas sp.]
MSKYCLNCGKPLPEKAKFCTFCGENLQPEDSENPSPEAVFTPKRSNDQPQSHVGKNFTLLEKGSLFQGYRVVKMLNKDAEGIKYTVEKDNQQYLLKIFYKSSIINIESLFALQKRLEKLNHVMDKHLARVIEIDSHHDPAYMIVEYTHGVSLAHIKAHNPDRLTEEFMRNVAPQLVNTAIVLRNNDLTLSALAFTNIMVDDEDNAIILSSAVSYELRDEREDLFALAVIIAQALSRHTLYKNIYSAEGLATQKFAYIAGVSIAFNKILGEALHRNILQRYPKLETFLEALINLPPVSQDEIWTVQEKGNLDKMETVNAADKPKTRIEFLFWFLIILIVTVLTVLLTTNIFSVLFGGKGEKLQYTGLVKSADVGDSLSQPIDDIERSGSPLRTAYGDLKSSSTSPRVDSRRPLPATENNASNAPVPAAKPKPPINMKFIDANTLGFGRLKENLHHNVSLSSFYIGKQEVTQGEWSSFMKPANCSSFGDKLPVDNVSWSDIAIYCNGRSEAEGLTPAYKIRGVGASRVITCDFKANGYRLPTEAEWEMAAKAGQLYNYSGSEDPEDIAWFKDTSGGKIRNTASKDANDWGLYDMTGNVSEWCWDWFDANYVRALPTFINPNGPATGTQKVIRGGSVANGKGRNLNILWREKGDPNRGYQFVGFRLVRNS